MAERNRMVISFVRLVGLAKKNSVVSVVKQMFLFSNKGELVSVNYEKDIKNNDKLWGEE